VESVTLGYLRSLANGIQLLQKEIVLDPHPSIDPSPGPCITFTWTVLIARNIYFETIYMPSNMAEEYDNYWMTDWQNRAH